MRSLDSWWLSCAAPPMKRKVARFFVSADVAVVKVDFMAKYLR